MDDEGSYQQIGIVSYGSSICESAEIPSVFTEILNYTTWIESETSTGIVTSYDASLAATESYYSEGDSGNAEVRNLVSESDSGGAIGSGLLMLGGWLTWARRRKQRK